MTLQKQNILFVEPDGQKQKIYRAVIKPDEKGWDLRFAADAEEALALNTQNPADIMIAPEQMLGTGTSFLDLVKEFAPGIIRFLLVSGQEAERMRSMVGPAQQTLTLPLEPVSFTDQVNKALTLRTLVNNPEIFKLVGGGDPLPPLPRTFEELNRKLSSIDTELSEIGGIIARDAVLSAKVLRTVNSAMFSLSSKVGNLSQAVSLLGTSTISSIVFAQGVFDAFKHSALDELFFEGLNRHSIVCARIVEKLLYNWGGSRFMMDQGVFCAFAHDLGKIVLSVYAKEKWDQSLQAVRAGIGIDIEQERRIIGIGHAEIAAYLLAIWGFSNDQVFAVAFHHDPALSRLSTRGTLCALHLAEHLLPTDFQRGDVDRIWLSKCGIEENEIAEYKELAEMIALRTEVESD